MGELRETINELFNLQGNKLFRTIKGLTVAPGNTIRTFAEGDRTTFLHPFTYALTLIGIMVFLIPLVMPDTAITKSSKIEQQKIIKEYGAMKEISEHEMGRLKMAEFFQEYAYGNDIQKYTQYVSFILISIIHLLVYKNIGFGLKKNSWYIFYVYPHVMILTMPFAILYSIAESILYFSLLSFGMTVITAIFQSWAASQFYEISFGRAIKKFIFSYLIMCSFVLFSVIIISLLLVLFFFKV